MQGASAIIENRSQTTQVTDSDQQTMRFGQHVDESQPKSKTYSVAATQPIEPEDAYLTGVSRSLQRRLLGLNVHSIRKSNLEASTVELSSRGPASEATVTVTSEKQSKIA